MLCEAGRSRDTKADVRHATFAFLDAVSIFWGGRHQVATDGLSMPPHSPSVVHAEQKHVPHAIPGQGNHSMSC
eukprot:3652541-Rhodomonas_salina.3